MATRVRLSAGLHRIKLLGKQKQQSFYEQIDDALPQKDWTDWLQQSSGVGARDCGPVDDRAGDRRFDADDRWISSVGNFASYLRALRRQARQREEREPRGLVHSRPRI
jgi:hypothetical protein